MMRVYRSTSAGRTVKPSHNRQPQVARSVTCGPTTKDHDPEGGRTVPMPVPATRSTSSRSFPLFAPFPQVAHSAPRSGYLLWDDSAVRLHMCVSSMCIHISYNALTRWEIYIYHRCRGVCQKAHLLFYAQSPDFHKPRLCYYLKILYL